MDGGCWPLNMFYGALSFYMDLLSAKCTKLANRSIFWCCNDTHIFRIYAAFQPHFNFFNYKKKWKMFVVRECCSWNSDSALIVVKSLRIWGSWLKVGKLKVLNSAALDLHLNLGLVYFQCGKMLSISFIQKKRKNNWWQDLTFVWNVFHIMSNDHWPHSPDKICVGLVQLCQQHRFTFHLALSRVTVFSAGTNEA